MWAHPSRYRPVIIHVPKTAIAHSSRRVMAATELTPALHRTSTTRWGLLHIVLLSFSVMGARTIVIVEDEAPIASAVAARLRNEGFGVEIAGDGPSAVELCERIHPDLVVLDLMLPGMDGLEVCRRVQRTRSVPVLMLTARDTEMDTVVGLAVGADDYMTKPFSPRELVARVHALLRRADRNPGSTNGSLR